MVIDEHCASVALEKKSLPVKKQNLLYIFNMTKPILLNYSKILNIYIEKVIFIYQKIIDLK